MKTTSTLFLATILAASATSLYAEGEMEYTGIPKLKTSYCTFVGGGGPKESQRTTGAVNAYTEQRKYEFTYNSKGLLSKETDFNLNGGQWMEAGKGTYTYDDDNNLTKIEYRASDGYGNLEEYEYSQGQKTKETRAYRRSDTEDWYVYSTTTWTYENGRLTAMEDGMYKTIYAYNDDGQLTSSTKYYSDNTVYATTQYTYNEDGNESQQLIHYEGGSGWELIQFEYSPTYCNLLVKKIYYYANVTEEPEEGDWEAQRMSVYTYFEDLMDSHVDVLKSEQLFYYSSEDGAFSEEPAEETLYDAAGERVSQSNFASKATYVHYYQAVVEDGLPICCLDTLPRVEIEYSRTYNGNWQAHALPFRIPAEVWSEGFEAARLTKLEDNKLYFVKLDATEDLEPNTPYLIKATTTDGEPLKLEADSLFKNTSVYLQSLAANALLDINYLPVTASEWFVSTFFYDRFALGTDGVLKPWNDSLYTNDSDVVLKAQRWSLFIQNDDWLSRPDFVVIEEATGIAQLQADPAATTAHDLMGRTVQPDRKGLVIRNGQKVLNR